MWPFTESALHREHVALYRLSLKVAQKGKDGETQSTDYDSAFEKALVGDVNDIIQQKRNFDEPLWKSALTGDLELYKTVENEKGEQRGAFGETVMHILFLFWPRDHERKAKYEQFLRYLIERHPKLINLIYEKEPYTGEHVLHMAIVNNDLPAVKMLVEAGASLECKATGTFFKPYGNWYQGAYPLSFAAAGGNKEIVTYLLEKGANPFLRDDVLGCNAIHITVVYEKPEIFDIIVDYVKKQDEDEHGRRYAGAVPDTVPRLTWGERLGRLVSGESLMAGDSMEMRSAHAGKSNAAQLLLRSTTNFRRTPLTLAAELGKVDMFVHLMNKEKAILWAYGTVQAAAYPLDEIDTYDVPQRHNRRSALELIVYLSGSKDEDMQRAKMLDVTPINQLMQQKWETFAKYWYYAWLLVYLLYLIIFSIVACDPVELDEVPGSRVGLQLVVLAGAVMFVVLESVDVLRMGQKYFNEKSSRLFFAVIWTYSLIIFVLAILEYGFPYQYGSAKSILLAIAAIFAWSYLLFFLRGQRRVGILVVMLQEMLFGDIVRWVTIYLVLMFGFATGFVALFNIAPPGDPLMSESAPVSQAGYYNPDSTPNFQTFSLSVESLYKSLYGDFSALGNYTGSFSNGMTVAMFVGYSILANVLLLNMLIAMLNFTFGRFQDIARLQWKLEWASIILLIERRMPRFLRTIYRSGNSGDTLGGSAQADIYYIILEEKIRGPSSRLSSENAEHAEHAD